MRRLEEINIYEGEHTDTKIRLNIRFSDTYGAGMYISKNASDRDVANHLYALAARIIRDSKSK